MLLRRHAAAAARHSKTCPPGQCVVVANHASYLDGVVMAAALPPRFGFVIKREMNDVPVAGLLLRRIGSEFVDRFNRHKGGTDARRVLRTAASGHSLVFFPEGTFTPEVGLGKIPHRRIRDRGARRLPGGAGGDPRHAAEHAGDSRPAAAGRDRSALRRADRAAVQCAGEDPALKLRDQSRAAILRGTRRAGSGRLASPTVTFGFLPRITAAEHATVHLHEPGIRRRVRGAAR